MLLKSREVIAVNQDPLGVAGDRVWKQGPYEVPPLHLPADSFSLCRWTGHLPLQYHRQLCRAPALA